MNKNMATMSWKSLALLWTIAFPAIFASSTKAAGLDPISPLQCGLGLLQIGGCVEEVMQAATTLNPSTKIGADCCKAIVELDDKCLGLLFPLNPGVPDLLKGICGAVHTTKTQS